MRDPICHVDSPIGRIGIAALGGAITAIRLPGFEPDEEPRTRPQDVAVIDRARRQLDEYFAGRRTRFDLPLAPKGTDFQRKVWKALCAIPFGETRSYVEIARAIGQPSAMRAVGAANRANPIAIVVPCHRVIGAGGDLVGYGGGLAIKRWLLEHERASAGHAVGLSPA